MERFSALVLWSFIACSFVTDGNAKGPVVRFERRGEAVVFPYIVKGTKHEVSEWAMSKTA